MYDILKYSTASFERKTQSPEQQSLIIIIRYTYAIISLKSIHNKHNIAINGEILNILCENIYI